MNSIDVAIQVEESRNPSSSYREAPNGEQLCSLRVCEHRRCAHCIPPVHTFTTGRISNLSAATLHIFIVHCAIQRTRMRRIRHWMRFKG